MSLVPLRLTAARYVLGMTDSDQLRRVADEALTRGVYSYRLGELGTTTNPTSWVARPLFEGAMRELGIPLPGPQDAAERLVNHYFRRIMEGTASMVSDMQAVRQMVYDPCSVQGYFSLCPTERALIRRLDGCYWRYDELEWTAGSNTETTAGVLEGLYQEIRRIAL